MILFSEKIKQAKTLLLLEGLELPIPDQIVLMDSLIDFLYIYPTLHCLLMFLFVNFQLYAQIKDKFNFFCYWIDLVANLWKKSKVGNKTKK